MAPIGNGPRILSSLIQAQQCSNTCFISLLQDQQSLKSKKIGETNIKIVWKAGGEENSIKCL